MELPPVLTLTNWAEFAQACPRDMAILREIEQEYNETMAPRRLVLG